MADQRWYFTKEQILNSPSRRCGIDAEKELSYRQQGAKLIQDMGQRLQVTQLVINTAIVYMHRFYMFHPFTRFHRNSIGPAALFLAAKVEEQPRKLEHVIKVAHYIVHHEHTNLDTQSEPYVERAQELVINENILLQTLGFDVAIDHPHTHVVKCFQMVRSKSPYNDRITANATTDLSKHLAETSYIMATNSLHMTVMCLQYKPAVVACVCIYIVCKWSNYEIQRFSEGRDWFCLVDPTVNIEMLDQLTSEFLAVLDKYPNRLKKVMNSGGPGGSSSLGEDRSGKHTSTILRNSSLSSSATSAVREVSSKTNSAKIAAQNAAAKTVLSHKEYSEKREKERQNKDKERVDHRDKNHLPSTSHNHHQQQQPPSNNVVTPPTQPSNLPHSRTHQQDAIMNMRKPRADHIRQISHGSANRVVMHQHPVKESIIKREFPIRSDDKSCLEKYERTSDNNIGSGNKLVLNDNKLKQNIDSKHFLGNDWNQCSQPVETLKKERKIEVKQESASEPEIRDLLEIKSEHKVFDIKNLKSEISSRTKGELKDIMKIEPSEEVKPKLPSNSNNFLFKTPFSYRDFMNPSEMPPDDIFDTEIDCKSNCVNTDFVISPTHHPKLKSPPMPLAAAPFTKVPPITITPSLSMPKENTISQTSIKPNMEISFHNSSDSKIGPKELPPNHPHAHGNHSGDKSNVGNGISNLNLLPNSQQPTLKRKRTRSRSPHALVGVKNKFPVPLAEPKVLLTSISEEEVKRLTKDNIGIPPVSFKNLQLETPKPMESNVIDISKNKPVTSVSTSLAPILDKVILSNQRSSIVSPMKGVLPAPELVSSGNSNLKVRLSHAENCDVKPLNTIAPVATPLTSSTFIPPLHKKHKHDPNHHKHKEKKKHKEKDKHKEKHKDKHKDKEAKEHKKNKKRKKEKHKEKEKEKAAEKDDAATPLKITLVRDKGIYTPDAGPAVSRSNTPVSLNNIQSEQTDTSSGIKLTIPRSRLQPNTPLSVVESPPRGLPPRDVGRTPKVKLKIHKDKSERESRKRDRIAAGHYPPNLSRSDSSQNAPQVGTSFNYQPHFDLAQKPLHDNSMKHIVPGPLHVPAMQRHSIQQQIHSGYPHSQNYPVMTHNYPMPIGCPYPVYRGSLPHNTTANTPYSQTVIHNDPYMPPFYPQYSMPLPNMNVPPPSYQSTIFSHPPPGYMQQAAPMICNPSHIVENPPLPPEPPPVKPPTPPPE